MANVCRWHKADSRDSGLSTFRSQGANQIQIQMNSPLPTTI
jgi:hypothetical protein